MMEDPRFEMLRNLMNGDHPYEVRDAKSNAIVGYIPNRLVREAKGDPMWFGPERLVWPRKSRKGR